MKTLDALLQSMNLNRLSIKKGGGKKIRSLHDLLMHQLADFRKFEQEQIKLLPELGANSNSNELNTIINDLIIKINLGVDQIKHILEESGENMSNGDSRIMNDIMEGVKSIISKSTGEALVIQTELALYIQYINHIEIANYHTLIRLANSLKYVEITGILEKLLSEKRNIDYRLSRLSLDNIGHSIAV